MRSIGDIPYRWLLALDGMEEVRSSWPPALYRFVKALARDMATWRDGDADGADGRQKSGSSTRTRGRYYCSQIENEVNVTERVQNGNRCSAGEG